MAWTAVGRIASTSNTLGNASAIIMQANQLVGAGAAIGDVLFAAVAVDNNSSGDGDEGAVTSITDNVSGTNNQWSKVAEFCNGQGASQAGATCSLWVCHVTKTISTANSITVNLSNFTARDAVAAQVYRFSLSGGSVTTLSSTWLAADGAQPGSMDDTLSGASREHLRFRAIASETTISTALTTSAGWTTIGTQGSGVTTNQGMYSRGEFIITSNTTAASNPTFGTADTASVFAMFEETLAMGQVIL